MSNFGYLLINTIYNPLIYGQLFKNFVSASLMNDNLYAFTYNKTLLSITFQELKKVEGLKVNYV